MSSTAKVSAIVVTWNSARDIAACLRSLLNQTHPLHEIILIDNASSDGTADLVANGFPSVKLTRLNYNAGFAKGNNIGISKSSGDWALALNPDAFLEPDWLAKLLAHAENRFRTGALGGLLLRMDGNSSEPVLDSLGIEIYKSRRVRDRGAGEPSQNLSQDPAQVFGVCAAAALYRRSMLDDIAINGEFFPETFYCYYEDADLAWRSWRRGWESWIIPTAIGRHRRGGSPTGAKFSRYLTHRNRLWMILRNDRFGSLLAALPVLIAHEAFIVARMLRYPYLFKASIEALAGIPNALRERCKLSSSSTNPPPFLPGVGFSAKEQKNAIQRGRNF